MAGPLDAMRDTRREWSINRARLIACLTGILMLMAVLVYRYYSLQIIQHDAFLTQSDRNRIRVETAYVDGYSFNKFFFKIFIPTIAAGIGITMFFCFMFSWVELLLAKTLTATMAKPIAAIMTRTSSTSGYELGLLAAAGSLTIVPGAVVIYFVRNYIAKGFAMGRV